MAAERATPARRRDRLYAADCGPLGPVADRSVDLVLADPPYGITGHPWDRAPDWTALLPALARVLKPEGQVAVFGTLTSLADLLRHAAGRFTPRFDLAWVKRGGMWMTRKKPIRRHESILVLARRGARAGDLFFDAEALKTPGRPYRRLERRRTHGWRRQIGAPYRKENRDGRRWPTTVIEARAVGGFHPEYAGHPAQKPLAVLEWLIRGLCPEGGTVLDPYAGVGSSWIAARRLDRRWIGFERDPRFVRVARARARSEDALRREAA